MEGHFHGGVGGGLADVCFYDVADVWGIPCVGGSMVDFVGGVGSSGDGDGFLCGAGDGFVDPGFTCEGIVDEVSDLEISGVGCVGGGVPVFSSDEGEVIEFEGWLEVAMGSESLWLLYDYNGDGAS